MDRGCVDGLDGLGGIYDTVSVFHLVEKGKWLNLALANRMDF